MGRNQTVRARLRAATASAHARVDDVFSRFDLASREDYGRFLQAQAAVLLPLERALDAGIAPRLDIDWPERRRGDALLSDLAALGLRAPATGALPPIERADAALGTIYVLEGSRLGGALLKRSVGAELPTRFMAAGRPQLWQRLIAALDERLPTPAQQGAAVEAAEAAFDRFEHAGRAALAEAVR